MKLTAIANILISICLVACAQENDQEQDNNESKPEMEIKKWKLIKMTGSMRNSETTGENMAWQEAISLNDDNQFTKTRVEEGITYEASGSYNYMDLSDGKYLELTYSSESKLIANCTSDLKELLRVDTPNTLVGTWQACDGPGLEYKYIE